MSPLEALKQSLDVTIADLLGVAKKGLHSAKYLPKEYEQIKRQFKDVGIPSNSIAKSAAKDFLLGEISEINPIVDMVAFAIHEKISEANDTSIFYSPDKLNELLGIYRSKSSRNIQMQLTWLGMFQSYFSAKNPRQVNLLDFQESQNSIRLYLKDTWGSVKNAVPFNLQWMEMVEQNIDLLSEDPCTVYAHEWFDGNDKRVFQVAADLDIPSTSWFWDELIISCIKYVTSLSDKEFKASIPRLLNLFEEKVNFLDVGLVILLERYVASEHPIEDVPLKEFCLDNWGSPEGYDKAGSKWQKISPQALDMVLAWVNETNLRLFFEILEERGQADQDRLNFWLRYVKQMRSTKLVLGPGSHEYVMQRRDLRKIFARESNTFSRLKDTQDQDAFMMTIGQFLVIEFSVVGGCYIYKNGRHSFDVNQKIHFASTSRGGLKEGLDKGARAFVHTTSWINNATNVLKGLGINPDYSLVQNGQANRREPFQINKYLNTGVGQIPEQPSNSSSTTIDSYASGVQAAKKIARDNGIECKATSAGFTVLWLKSNGPLATSLEKLGFEFSYGIGWVLE